MYAMRCGQLLITGNSTLVPFLAPGAIAFRISVCSTVHRLISLSPKLTQCQEGIPASIIDP